MAKHFTEAAPGIWHPYRPTSVVNPACSRCGDYDRSGGRRGWRWRLAAVGQGRRLTEAICGRCYVAQDVHVISARAV